MRVSRFFGAAVAVALLSGCTTGNAGSPSGSSTPRAELSNPPVQTSQPSPTPVPAETPGAPITVPETPAAPIPPLQSPDAVPATFTFNCREIGAPVDYQIPPESFASLEAIWADTRDMFCIPMQTGDTYTYTEVEAAKLALTGGMYPGVSGIQVGVWDVYMWCAYRDMVGAYNRLLDNNRENYRVVIQGALMACPQHPQADQLRGL